jgi:DNA polymerase-3 subunit gamma/tau
MLSTSAFNALLKTIEEPPPYVIFIFATTELHKVPATIKSRCQQFHFRLVAVDQIKALLSIAAMEVGLSADDEALYWIAREATGSIRDAYTLFDQVAAFSGGHITYEKIRDKLGLVGTEQLNALCEQCAAGKATKALQAVDTIFEGGVSVEQFISNMADYFRSLLFIQSGVVKEALLGQAPERFSGAVLSAWNAGALEHALSLFLALYRDVRYSLNPRYEVDLAVSRLCWLSSWVSAGEVKAAIDDAKNLLLGAGAVPLGQAMVQAPANFQRQYPATIPSASAAIPPAPAAPLIANPDLSVEELRALALSRMEESREMTAAVLSQTSAWTASPDRAVISMLADSEFVVKQVVKDAAYIADLLTALWGHKTGIEIKGKSASAEEASEMPKTIPLQAEIVCKVFKGSILEEKK